MSILITGGTGSTRMETLRILGQRSASGVRALVGDTEKANLVASHGMEPAIGTFEDRPALDAALWSKRPAKCLCHLVTISPEIPIV